MFFKTENIFRQEALNSSAIPGELEEVLEPVNYSSCLHLIISILTVFIILFWAFFGIIRTEVKGNSIFLSNNNSFNIVYPEGDGIIKQINYSVGDYIKKGDIIAIAETPIIDEKISNLNKILHEFNVERERILKLYPDHIISQQNYVLNKKYNLLKEIHSNQDKTKTYKKLKDDYQRLFDNGLITKTRLQEIIDIYNKTMHDIANAKSEIEQLELNIKTYENEYSNKIHDINLKLLENESELNEITLLQEKLKYIKSEVDGVVDESYINDGDKINKETPIIKISNNFNKNNSDILVFSYIPIKEGKKIKVGNKVRIIPSTITFEEGGAVLGQVISISNFPVSYDHIYKKLGNRKLADEFISLGSPIEILIKPEKDNRTYTGFKWTTNNGPDVYLTTGTIAEVEIIVKEQKPIFVLLPYIKSLL